MDLVSVARLGRSGLAIQRLNAHALHQRSHMTPANMHVLLPEHIAQHPGAGKRILQVQLVDAMHQGQVPLTDWTRLVIHTATAQPQQLGLSSDRQRMGRVDHFFALSNPALVSALSKKSFSSVSSPILACSTLRSTGGVASSVSPPKARAAWPWSWFFHWVIWLACTSYICANSARVDRKSTRLNSSHVKTSYAVHCLQKKQQD